MSDSTSPRNASGGLVRQQSAINFIPVNKPTHCRMNTMCNPRPARMPLSASAFLCALLSLVSLLLLPTRAPAQMCGTGLAGDIAVSPSTAHVGDTVTINFLEVFSSLNTCAVTNGKAWIIFPDNSVQLWLNNFNLQPNSAILCPGNAACLPGVSFSYVVKSNDMSRSLMFQTNFPAGFNF